MKKFLICLVVTLTCFIGDSFAYPMNPSVVINPNESFTEDIHFDETSVIENNGILNSDIYVCDRCFLYIKNSGIINSDFHLGDNAKIVQLVYDAKHVNKIDFGVNYSVRLESNDVISVKDFAEIASGADAVVVKNATLDLTDVTDVTLPPMEFQGVVKLIVNNMNSSEDVLLLRNVSGTGTVYVADSENNPMYSRTVYNNGGNLFLKGIRETSYDSILDAETGNMIEDLKGQKPDNPMFDKIDSAQNPDEVKAIIKRSVYFNPDVLFDALRVVNVLDVTAVSDSNNGFGIMPFGGMSDDFYLYGVGLRFAADVTDSFNIDFGLRIAQMDFKNSFNDFSNTMYGASLTMNYVPDEGVFVRGMVSANLSDLGIDMVVYDGDIINNPRALSGVALLDVGYKFKLDDSFYVSPFVGGVTEMYIIDDVSLDNTYARAGIGAGYIFDSLGIRYDYNVRFASDTNNDISLNLQIDVMSEMDAIGGNLNLSAAYVLDMLNYSAMANIKFLF